MALNVLAPWFAIAGIVYALFTIASTLGIN